MTPRFQGLILIAAWLSCSPPAFTDAQFEDGNRLLQDCLRENLLFCFGYVDAIADVLASNIVNGYHACIPRNVIASQL